MIGSTLSLWSRVGAILVREGSITEEELQRALAEQRRLKKIGDEYFIGEVCVGMGFCKKKTVDLAIKYIGKLSLVRKDKTSSAVLEMKLSVRKLKEISRELCDGVQIN